MRPDQHPINTGEHSANDIPVGLLIQGELKREKIKKPIQRRKER
jgi:hypothetical protein